MRAYKKISINLLIIISIILFLAMVLNATFAANTINIDNTTEGGIYGAITNNANDGDTILLDSGNYLDTNNTGISINKNIILQGNGPTDSVTIDAQNFRRIFTIENNLNVTFINITFKNGYASVGGAIYNSYNDTQMTFIDCAFTNNTGDEYEGGAIYNKGDVTLTGCTFINNSANFGGAICNYGNVTLTACTFTNNTAVYGGAIFIHYGASATLTSCSFINNNAIFGGAIGNDGSTTLSNCTFRNNVAKYYGGAIYNDVSVTLTNCTFYNNSAYFGAAIHTMGNDVVSNSNFIENYGSAAIYIDTGDVSIIACNIFNNSEGIFINSRVVNVVINYNRIFNNSNGTGYNLNNEGNDINANFNWWGDNRDPLSYCILNIGTLVLDNYFLVNVINNTSIALGGVADFNYSFYLNTTDFYDLNLLTYFDTDVFTNVTGFYDSFDAIFNKTEVVKVNVAGQFINYEFVIDNQVFTFSLYSVPLNVTINGSVPKSEVGNTVNVTFIFKDQFDVLINGTTEIFLNEKSLGNFTVVNGIVVIPIMISQNDNVIEAVFSQQTIYNPASITLSFKADNGITSPFVGGVNDSTDNINNSDDRNNVDNMNNTDDRNNTDNLNETNKTNTNPVVVATMKKTGMPIVGLLLTLLTTLVWFVRRSKI